jgi:hypothetical protein
LVEAKSEAQSGAARDQFNFKRTRESFEEWGFFYQKGFNFKDSMLVSWIYSSISILNPLTAKTSRVAVAIHTITRV